MDTLLFSSPSKNVAANTMDQQGFGSRPPERSKQIKKESARTSLFGKEDDASAVSPQKPRKVSERNASNIGLSNGAYGQSRAEAEQRQAKGGRNNSAMQGDSFKSFRWDEGNEEQPVSPYKGKRNYDTVGRASWTPAIQQEQPDHEPSKPHMINPGKKRSERASSSLGMRRLLCNPQDSQPQPSAKTNRGSKPGYSKFITNSSTQMVKLSELDRKTKHAHKRMSSNVFSQTMPVKGISGLAADSNGELVLKRKGGAGNAKRNAAMGSIMQHDEGPYAKLDWPSKKGQVSEKPSQTDRKKITRQTFIKVMTDRKEPRKTAETENKSQIF